VRFTILETLLYLIATQLCSSTLFAKSVPQITLDLVTRDFALWLVSTYSMYKPRYNPTLLNQGYCYGSIWNPWVMYDSL